MKRERTHEEEEEDEEVRGESVKRNESRKKRVYRKII